MTHRFPVKEIAAQAGVGTATVDRVLNNRPHVSALTAARVAAAISELDAQEAQLAAKGRRMFFDFVIEAPIRFSREVQRATEQVLTQVGGAACRVRFVTQEIMDEAEVVRLLTLIARRGSHGVCLKARDTPAIRAAVDRLVAIGVPVVTLVTDITSCGRIAYVGLDNQSAGRTAAYLVATALGNVSGTVLTLRSNDRFLGEEERETAFTTTLAKTRPALHPIAICGGSGIHHETARLLDDVVDSLRDLKAVYSVGGGNITILDILEKNRLCPSIYIAHDLDRDNRMLIETGKLGFVLHHDLKADVVIVFQTLLHSHRLVPDPPTRTVSNVLIITPENIPAPSFCKD